jgi:hypothetical protein
MKYTRLALAILTVSVFAACSSDVTGPSNVKPTSASQDFASGGYGPQP